MKIGSITGSGIYAIARAAAWVSGGCVTLIMFLTATDVIARYAVVRPLKGTIDLTVLMIVVLAFLAFGYAQIHGTHIAVHVVTSRLSKHTNAILATITRFLGILTYLLMAWAISVRAWGYMFAPAKAPVSELLFIPYVPFMFVAATGVLILLLVLIVDFARSLTEVVSKS